jgi:hypothetical protein
MAKRTACAVVIVRHLVKDATKAAMYRGSGSIGIIGAARAALSVGRDKTDKDRCIVVPAKSNWSKLQPGIAYKVEEVGYVTEDGTAITTSRIVWDGLSILVTRSLLPSESWISDYYSLLILTDTGAGQPRSRMRRREYYK